MKKCVKAGYVHDILRNKTYLPESGLYKNLFDELMKLPGDALSNLNLIVNVKLQEKAEEPNRKTITFN